jgi:hypothetical protein
MKHRSSRERGEAAMRVRNARTTLKKLQRKLRRSDESYRKAMLAQFWEQFRIDRRIAKGEL